MKTKPSDMGTGGLIQYVAGEQEGRDYIRARQRMGVAKRILTKRGYWPEQLRRFELAVRSCQ